MAIDTKEKLKSMSEQRFLDHIYEGYQAGQRYCFVLGAGASKESGIRTGEEMMREWRMYLRDKGSYYIKDCASDLGLEEKDYLHIFESDYTLANDDYFTLFDLRFAGQPNVAYAYLENEMEEKYPSYGYFPLAKLLSKTENRLVITTNFDTLLEDALYTYTFKHPMVVGHESLASYLVNDNRHPMIAKIHRDLLFHPFNRKEDMDKLKDEWEQPLGDALSRYIPIVIGYAGGDHTFMSLLEKVKLKGIYWCHLGDTLPGNIKDTLIRHNGYTVRILGFDEIMFRLGDRFAEEVDFGAPCEYIREQAEKRCSLYQTNLEKVKEICRTQKSGLEDVLGSENDGENIVGLIDAIERYDNRQSDGGETDKDISRLESEVWKKYNLGEYEKALEICTRLINLEPNNAEYYDWRSTVFCKMKQYDKAVQDATKAIELEPANAEYYYGCGVMLHEIGEYDKAVEDKTKAIELETTNAKYYNSRSITLSGKGEYDEALQDVTKAIELEPTNAKYYNSRGITLYEKGEYDKALQDVTKAIELDSANAEYYYGRSLVLYKKGEYDKALLDDIKAIELDPTNAKYYSSRAMTLHKLNREEEARRDEIKAEELAKSK